MSNLLTEMYTILGWPQTVAAAPKSDTPREVVGTFMVQTGVTALDETMLESISDMEWDDVFDIASLAALGPEDFSRLVMAYHESTTDFREAWNAYIEEGLIERDMNRGVFMLLAQACPRTESMARYVEWCLRAVVEASEETKKKSGKKAAKFHSLIPAGSAEQHAKYVNAAEKQLTPVDMAGKEVMANGVFKNKEPDKPEGMAKVVKAEKAMKKIADKAKMAVDQAFPNLFADLARERVRNS